MTIASTTSQHGISDPQRIGPYDVLGRLGNGGAAAVYRANSEKTGPVAVKLLHHADAQLADVATEFHMASRVDPAFTSAPVAFGVDDAGPYLVMRLLPRHGPLSRAHRGSFSAPDLWRIAAAIARAIAASHRAGVIHCDVKPANLLVYGDSVRLIDFGIARLINDQPQFTSWVRFSRGWAAPEQLASAPLTPAVDVFAWGCVMTSLASGAGPYSAASDDEWIYRVRHEEPNLEGLPLGLDQLVRAALLADPAQRPTAEDLAMACDVPQRVVAMGSPRARFDTRRSNALAAAA